MYYDYNASGYRICNNDNNNNNYNINNNYDSKMDIGDGGDNDNDDGANDSNNSVVMMENLDQFIALERSNCKKFIN